MSSISSIGGGTDLAELFKNISAARKSSSPAVNSPANSPTTLGSATNTGATQEAHRHHHHGKAQGATSSLFDQLQQTVSSAMQSAQQSGSNPNQSISDAISKIFKNNTGSASTAVSGATQASDADPDAGHANMPASLAGGATAAASSSHASIQSFLQLLQSSGVDSQQFNQDFLHAVQNAQNGTVNAASAFQSLPKGSVIDAIG